MFGKTRRKDAYYAWQPDHRHHDERAGWYADHPASLWVRVDILLELVQAFFAERTFGPAGHELLGAQLAQHTASTAGTDGPAMARRRQMEKLITDIERRRANLIAELEDKQPTGDPDADREYRQTIQRRFTELTTEHRARSQELLRLGTAEPPQAASDAELLAQIPEVSVALARLPEALQRRLYDVFQLQVRYHRPRHQVTIRVTIRAGALSSLTPVTDEMTARSRDRSATDGADGICSHVLGAPARRQFGGFICPAAVTWHWSSFLAAPDVVECRARVKDGVADHAARFPWVSTLRLDQMTAPAEEAKGTRITSSPPPDDPGGTTTAPRQSASPARSPMQACGAAARRAWPQGSISPHHPRSSPSAG